MKQDNYKIKKEWKTPDFFLISSAINGGANITWHEGIHVSGTSYKLTRANDPAIQIMAPKALWSTFYS